MEANVTALLCHFYAVLWSRRRDRRPDRGDTSARTLMARLACDTNRAVCYHLSPWRTTPVGWSTYLTRRLPNNGIQHRPPSHPSREYWYLNKRENRCISDCSRINCQVASTSVADNLIVNKLND